MIRRDFMMRQIEEWAKLMGYILGLRKDGDFRAAENQLDDLIQIAGPPGLLDHGPFTDFLDSLDRGGIVDADHLALLGKAIFEKYSIQREASGIPLDQVDMLGNKALYVLLKGILANPAIFRMSEMNAVNMLAKTLPEIETRTAPLLAEFLEAYGE